MASREDTRVRVDALFAQALDLEGAAREAFLEEATTGEPGLRAELESLLQFAQAPAPHLEPGAWVDTSLWQAVAEELEHGGAREPAEGRRIGSWQLKRELGRGGMGTVYLAERVDGEFQQRGALKLIRAGIDSDEFLRRFAQERQILASLSHPGIARLLDGGRDADQRPYLVMEFVEGVPIDRYCDEHRLDIDRRLGLLADIGRAVAHAHRHLIVHRDLKPSNIVVTAQGEVKLLDFGIAKVLTDADAAPEPALTRTLARLFTPEYAAPEQVLGLPAATSTDVYQLGLLLYELLTGKRAQTVEDVSPATLERAICHGEPLRPSQCIADDAPAQAISQARSTTPAALRRKLRGDLDNIVLKALRKAPERRYGSASALVEDIERWQQGQPVRARPETLGYRTRKFLQRHPMGVTAAAAAVTLLIAYAVTVTLQAQAIARERDRARAEATKARQVQALVLRIFEGADPEHSGTIQLSARELLDRGWAGIESDLKGQPEIQAEILDTVGEAYRQLGLYERAQPLFERAVTTTGPMAAKQPLLHARALRSRGRVSSDQGNHEQAQAQLRQALALYRQELGESHAQVATTMNDLGAALYWAGDYTAAEQLHRDALAMRRKLFGEEHAAVAESLDDLGLALREQGDYAGAEPVLSQALALRRRLLPPSHPLVASSLSNLALTRTNLGEYDSAEALYREALRLMASTRGEEHPYVATVMNNLARLLNTQRDFVQAESLLRQALEIRRRALGERHPTVALNLNDLGLLLAETGKLDEADALYRQALEAYEPAHPWRAATIFNVGRLAELRGDFPTAERQYRQALSLQREQYGAEHERVGTDLYRLGIVLHRQGRLDEAETHMRQALAIYRKRLPEQHPRLALVLVPLGTLLTERGHADEAEPLLREALRARHTAFGDGDPRTIEASRALAHAQRALR